MAITLKDKMKGLSPARRKKVEARAAQLIAEEMTLQEPVILSGIADDEPTKPTSRKRAAQA